MVDRKYAVTFLMRCLKCRLLYRAPTTAADDSVAFYQWAYRQGFTTDLPDDERLRDLIRTSFRGSEKDYRTYLEVLLSLGTRPGERLLDFGCSWGYGSWQLKRAGYEVQAFEISRPRCEFARMRLGIDALSELNEVGKDFDVVFSAHVLEHVPAVEDAISLMLAKLRPGGLLVAFTPNGSLDRRNCDAVNWHRGWGLVHPQMLDDQYYRSRFSQHPFLLASTPFDLEKLRQWGGIRQSVFNIQGGELLFAVRTGGGHGDEHRS